jgi:hypothetical protein
VRKNNMVVHCQKEPFDVYIGRPGPYGNPFRIGIDGTREEVIAKYKALLETDAELQKAVRSLKGKVLGCWCKPLPCHGDVIVAWLENDDQQS